MRICGNLPVGFPHSNPWIIAYLQPPKAYRRLYILLRLLVPENSSRAPLMALTLTFQPLNSFNTTAFSVYFHLLFDIDIQFSMAHYLVISRNGA